MHHHTRRLTLGILTALMLTVAVSSAHANRLSVSNGNIRTTWTSVRLSNTANSEVVLCAVTLEGSFHSATIAKTTNLLVGYITRATAANPCTGGTLTIHAESLPWHVRYQGFTGTLPSITGVKYAILGEFFEISAPGNTCSIRTEAVHPGVGVVNVSGGTALSLTPDAATRIPMTNGAGGIFCGLANGIFSETTQTLTVLGTTTRITITLI